MTSVARNVVAGIFSLLFTAGACSGSGGGGFHKKWIVVPGASFSAGKLDPAWPACPTADYPLACPEDAGCCPEGYAYACPEQDRCYSQPPASECPGFLTCAPVKLIITSISPDNASVKYGQSVQVAVDYKDYTGVGVTDLVIQALGIDGRFEQPITGGQTGSVPTTITVTDEQPTLDSCLLDCSRDGSCGPCFVADELFESWKIDFALR
ncbi:MAG: hypothetical protein D6806_07695, partial [Deltaproteobacteria bacterium]